MVAVAYTHCILGRTDAALPGNKVLHFYYRQLPGSPCKKAVQVLKRHPLTQGRLLAGVWDLTTAYARQLKSMSLVERKKEAAKRVQSLINAHKGSVTLDMVKKNTRQPEPYSHPSKTSVTEVFTNCILPLVYKTVSKLQASHGSQPHYTLSMTTA